ncbi:MAG: hypothetical protein LBU51_00940 [Bacteroidales bacterium]|jgi:hypothetical protein|nr:hypothetical protein [Bacteroidales bacterium]
MKNKLRLFLISILLITATLQINAQENSSYMGNRVLFDFSTTFSPSWLYPNFFENSDHWRKYYSFNYDITPSIEIIVHRKGSVGALYHFCKTKFEYFYDDDFTNYSYDTGIDAGNITVHGFGIFYKQYVGSAARTPFGTYFKFQFDGFFYNAVCSLPFEQISKGYLFATKAAIGHDFLFFDRLRVSTAFSLGIPLTGWKGIFETIGSSYDASSGKSNVQGFINNRLAGMYFFGFEVHIGLLAF